MSGTTNDPIDSGPRGHVCVLLRARPGTRLGRRAPAPGSTSNRTRPGERSSPGDKLRPSVDVAANTAAIMQRTGATLYQATLQASDPGQAKISSVSLMAVPDAEPRTMKKHDLVTIIIREESDFSSKGTSDLKKDLTLDAGIDDFVKLSLSNFEIKGGGLGATPPQVKLHGSREHKGDATVDRQDTFTARITGEVLDVKPNGTLVIQARKQIKTDEEEQEFTLTGICRAEDIGVDNTLLSTQIYDLSLQKNHKGAVRDTNKRGFITKLLDFINPF